MSLFSSLSPPGGRADAFSGLPYVAALRAGYTQEETEEPPPPPASFAQALALAHQQQAHRSNETTPFLQMIKGDVKAQVVPAEKPRAPHVPLPSPPPARPLVPPASSASVGTGVASQGVAPASVDPRRRSSVSSSASETLLLDAELSGWAHVDGSDEGHLASLLNARRASTDNSATTAPHSKRSSLRQSPSVQHAAPFGTIASALASPSQPPSAPHPSPPRTNSMPLGVSLHLTHLAQSLPQGSQTARGPLKPPSRESTNGPQIARIHTAEEKRDDAPSRSLSRSHAPATPPVSSTSASMLLFDSRSPLLPAPARVSHSFGGRTLEDELLELDRERRARARERMARARGLEKQGEGDEKVEGRVKFPRIPGAAVAPNSDDHHLEAALHTAQSSARALQLPYLSASVAAEESPVLIDSSAHESMFADKVATFTHRLTVALQANLELARKKVAAAEQARLAAVRAQMREVLRFYHQNEGRIYDVSRSVREALRNGQLAQLEHDDLTKQQGLIHEDYATQQAQLHAQLLQLHATGKDMRTHEYLQAHSKTADAQGSRLARRGSRGASHTPNLLAPSPLPTSSQQSALGSSLASSSEDGSSRPLAHAAPGHSRSNSSRLALTRISPQRSPALSDASSSTAPANATPLNLEALSAASTSTPIPSAASTAQPQDSGSGSSRRASHRRSRDGSIDLGVGGNLAPGHSRRASRGSRDDSSRRSSRDSLSNETALTIAHQQQQALHAKLELLRTYWQEQFAGARQARGVLKEVKSELLALEKATGTQLELELAKTASLEQQLEQMEANHAEALGQRADELKALEAEHARIEAANEALQAEARTLAKAARDHAATEETIWARVAEHKASRLEVSRANASVAREVERSFSQRVRQRFEAAQHAQVVLRQVKAELQQVATCESCGFLIKSASLTWESGETACEKCAFQRLFPSNFQSVVRAMHKQFANAANLAAKKKQDTPMHASIAQEQEAAPPQSTPTAPSSVANLPRPVDGVDSRSLVVATAAASPSSTLSHLKTHLSTTRLSAPESVASAALDDLGARLLEQLTPRPEQQDSDDEEAAAPPTAAAVGERIRRGSLGGIADALTAMNDAAVRSPAPPTAAAAAAAAGEHLIFPEALPSVPSPSPPSRKLQELSEVNSTEARVAACVTQTPFTLLWMKNHVVDSWIARFQAYTLQLDDLASHAHKLPAIMHEFEAALMAAPTLADRRTSVVALGDRRASVLTAAPGPNGPLRRVKAAASANASPSSPALRSASNSPARADENPRRVSHLAISVAQRALQGAAKVNSPSHKTQQYNSPRARAALRSVHNRT